MEQRDVNSQTRADTFGMRPDLYAALSGNMVKRSEVDELSPLVDFCSVSTPPGSGDAMIGTGRLPMSHVIGEYKGCTPMNNMIRLDDRGLWSLTAMVTTSFTQVWDPQDCQVWLRVIKPDGGLHSVYRQQGYFMSTLKVTTMSLTTTVMVKEPGYFADVYVIAALPQRGWLTGPEWSNLTVQHINRGITGGTGGEDSSEAPDNPEDQNGGSEGQ